MSDRPPQDLPEDPDLALAGEYVLRLLGPQETAACAAREARDPAFAALVAAWRADFEALDGTYEEVAPPRGLEQAIAARLFGAPPPSALARLWRSAGLWRGLAAAALLAAVWLGAILTPPQPPGEAPPRLVSALAPQPGSDVALVAVYEPQSRVLDLSRTSGAAAPGRSLELWVIAGGTPYSLGVLPSGPLARVSLTPEQAARLAPGNTLAVTSEEAGGSKTGEPALPPVAAGTVSEI